LSIGLTLYCVALGSALLAGQFSAGDRVVTVNRAPLMDGDRVMLYVPAGRRFKALQVQDDWVCVEVDRDGQPLYGWIHASNLMLSPSDLVLLDSWQDSLEPGQGGWHALPVDEHIVITVSATAPVDVFVVSEEGLEGYKTMLDGRNSMFRSYRRMRNTTFANIDWFPPFRGRFYVIIDNTRAPDGGASPLGRVGFTLRIWQRTAPLGEPRPGLLLVLGRVTLDYDSYKGRNGRYRGPMTVYISSRPADGDNGGSEDVIEAVADYEGYFAVGNLLAGRQYRVEKVEGRDFVARIPIIYARATKSDSPNEAGRPHVLDLGHIALTVNPEGKLGCVVETPDVRVASGPEKQDIALGFSDQTPLARHLWFERTHADSSWVQYVRADRLRIEQQRREERRKRAEKARRDGERRRAAPPKPAPSPPRPPRPAPKPAPRPSMADLWDAHRLLQHTLPPAPATNHGRGQA